MREPEVREIQGHVRRELDRALEVLDGAGGCIGFEREHTEQEESLGVRRVPREGLLANRARFVAAPRTPELARATEIVPDEGIRWFARRGQEQTLAHKMAAAASEETAATVSYLPVAN